MYILLNDKIKNVSMDVVISCKPLISSVTDYYSFGSEIFERTYSLCIDFGFNDKEKIIEY